nr:senescence-associated carboxylesterase 101-like isoform X1 [Ipomoea batatas]
MAAMMNPSPLFSSGQELASLAISSDVLRRSWNAISELRNQSHGRDDPTSPLTVRVNHQVFQDASLGTIIAFVTTADCTGNHLRELGTELVSYQEFSATLSSDFDFIDDKVNSSFHFHKAAVDLFVSVKDDLSSITHQFESSRPVIITGHSLGGSVASLFTLWLLDSMSARMYRNSTLCITFGSPLLGDNGFQEAISEYPRWNSSFLHVVYDKDPILFFVMSDQNDDTLRPNSELCSYRPFGTTLICSESGYSCFEDTESVLELMKTIVLLNSTANQNPGHCWPQFVDYGGILERLCWKMVCKGISKLPDSLSNPLQAGIVLQLDEIGIEKMKDGKNTSCLVTKIVERAVSIPQHKRNGFLPSKILMEMKVHITHLEWYMKGIVDQVGYYDRYKTIRSRSRDEAKSKLEIIQHHKILNLNWERIVREAENMLQKEGANFQGRWLYAGTNYRRIVEPLDIAEYYSKGKRDYLTQGRSEHYKVLEQWWKDDLPVQIADTKRSRASTLTEDSCFWAHVEEAIILCKLLKNGQNSRDVEDSFRKELIKFEEYVMDLVNNYSVSYQIFWPGSTFMQWWREYCKIVGDTYNSPLSDFMKHHYHKYS